MDGGKEASTEIPGLAGTASEAVFLSFYRSTIYYKNEGCTATRSAT